jgi:hypothetical protein
MHQLQNRFYGSQTYWLFIINVIGMAILAVVFKSGPQAIGDGIEPGPGDWLYDLFFIVPLLAGCCLLNTSALVITFFSKRPNKKRSYAVLTSLCFLWPAAIFFMARFL